MTAKSKKSKASGRFGSRYGKNVRARISAIESHQRIKQICPLCKKKGVKRISNGIWECPKCGKKFASNTYHLKS